MSFKKEYFSKVVYYAFGGIGSGGSAADPKPIVDGDVMAIEAGMVITSVDVAVSTAITGSTAIDIGDDDDQNGFVAAATLTAGALSSSNGAYLSANSLHKYYPVAGKEVKLDNTTANTAGAFAVCIEGYKV